MQSLKGGAGRPAPPPPGMHKDATIWAAKNNLAPWEVHAPAPRTRVPRSVVLTNPPPSAKQAGRVLGTRQATRIRNNQYKAAQASAIPGTKVKIDGHPRDARQYLASTMTPQEKRTYDRLHAPQAGPVDPKVSLGHELLHGAGSLYHLLATPGPEKYERTARAAEAIAKQQYRTIEPFIPHLPTATPSGLVTPGPAPNVHAQTHAIKYGVAGPALYNLATRGDVSHLGSAGLDLLALAPIGPGEIGNFGRSLRYAGMAAKTAESGGRLAAARDAIDTVMGSRLRPSELRAAAKNVELQSDQRDAVHALIDDHQPNKAIAAMTKRHLDGHINKALKTVAPEERAAAAREMYANAADSIEHMPGEAQFNLKRALSSEQAAQNLRYVEGGDLYKAQRGLHRNGKVFRTVNGVKGVQIIGRVTPQAWVKRVLAAVPDAVE